MAKYSPIIQEKILSLAQSFSAMIFLISPNFWQNLFREPNLRVCLFAANLCFAVDSFPGHELDEEVLPNMKLSQKATLGRTTDLAINSAHGLAFHRGLGEPLHPTSSSPLTKYLNVESLKEFSTAAYAKSNIALVANGADASEVSKWVKEFFSDISSQPVQGAPEITATQTKYYGGEERIAHDSGNTMILAFPGSSSFTGKFWKPEIAVLASLLGGESSIKWSPGFSLLARATEAFPGAHISTKNATYSDAGLLYVTLAGNAREVRSAAGEVVKKVKGVAAGEVSSEDFKKAVATAKFLALDAGQNLDIGLEATGAGLIQGGKAHQIDEVGKSIDSVSESKLKSVRTTTNPSSQWTNMEQAAKELLEGKASVSTVGDLHLLPYAEEIGLRI